MFEITLENFDLLDSVNNPSHLHNLTPEENDAMSQWREYCECVLPIFVTRPSKRRGCAPGTIASPWRSSHKKTAVELWIEKEMGME